MFRNTIVISAIALSILGGCSTVKISERNTSIVLAKDTQKDKGPIGISEKFGLEGKIVAYLTFLWDDTKAQGGVQTIEVRWFSGDRLISSPKKTFTFSAPPYYVWFPTLGTALGVGKARVEVYVDGVFSGSKSFEVVERI